MVAALTLALMTQTASISYAANSKANAPAAPVEPTAAPASHGRLNFNFKDVDFDKIIEEYSKATGQRFIIDPSVHGKITLINQEPVTPDEAFKQLSSALAILGIALSNQDGVMIVSTAREIERSYIPVSKELSPLRPDHLQTLIIDLKYALADDVNRQLRILASRNGEIVPFTSTNQIYVTDWVSNLHRISNIIKEIDIPLAKSSSATPRKVAPSGKTPKK